MKEIVASWRSWRNSRPRLQSGSWPSSGMHFVPPFVGVVQFQVKAIVAVRLNFRDHLVRAHRKVAENPIQNADCPRRYDFASASEKVADETGSKQSRVQF